jgi:hypothetical protein
METRSEAQVEEYGLLETRWQRNSRTKNLTISILIWIIGLILLFPIVEHWDGVLLVLLGNAYLAGLYGIIILVNRFWASRGG